MRHLRVHLWYENNNLHHVSLNFEIFFNSLKKQARYSR